MLKKTLLDSIEVKTPCHENWDEMSGNDQIRFCSHCAKSVHNLSTMTRKQARKIVAESNGGICVRYVRRPDGRIQHIKNTLYQITRRTGIAAGVLGTSLSVSALAYAQTTLENNQSETQVVEVVNQKSDSPNGTISGTVTDQNGAVVPYALVTLFNEQTNYYQSINANHEGFYELKDVPNGTYKLKIEMSGFATLQFSQITVGEGRETTQNAQLTVQEVKEVVTVGDEVEVTDNVLTGFVIDMVCPTNLMVQAVYNDNLEEVKARIAMGERVNSKDKCLTGNSPLHIAVENGNIEMTQLLLSAGAKTNSKNAEKRTPLMMLDDDATPELVFLLLRYGAKVNAVDGRKNTPLMLAARYTDKDVVQALLNAGAKVNVINKEGRTALMYAAEEGETEIVQYLLGAGANPNFRTREGETALSVTKNEETKQYLIAYGAIQ